jgi:hypothetical protein
MIDGEVISAVFVDLETGELRDLDQAGITQRLNQLCERAAEVKKSLESYEQEMKGLTVEAATLQALTTTRHKHSQGSFVAVAPSTGEDYDKDRLNGLLNTLREAWLHTVVLAIENCKVASYRKGYSYFKLNRD